MSIANFNNSFLPLFSRSFEHRYQIWSYSRLYKQEISVKPEWGNTRFMTLHPLTIFLLLNFRAKVIIFCFLPSRDLLVRC
mgnify:CR=1 FL=1